MLRRFTDFVTERDLLAEGGCVVAGVSGGVDSVVLLHLLREGGFVPVAAHVNYGRRGADSDADEALVRRLCTQWGVPLRVHRGEIGGSVQEAAREVRYAFFGAVADEVGASAVATAHHRDDQAETLLLNLFRGAGPVGLAGIPVRRPLTPDSTVEVVRPLLWALRSVIEAYARAHELPWREDASNQSVSYRRNVVRHEVLPLLEAHFGEGVGARIAHAADLLREALDSGAALVPSVLFEEVADRAGALRLGGLTEQALPVRRALLLEALRRWAPDAPRSTATVREVESLLDAQPGRRIEWPAVTIWRDRERLVFETTARTELAAVAVQPGETVTPFGTLHVEVLDEVPETFDTSPCIEVVDADWLRFPLTLRPWQAGDVLRPFGMDGHKKVSDLLTEHRVPSHQRDHQLVLCSGEVIVWVVGHRLGAEGAVGERTRRAARLTWTGEALARCGSGA